MPNTLVLMSVIFTIEIKFQLLYFLGQWESGSKHSKKKAPYDENNPGILLEKYHISFLVETDAIIIYNYIKTTNIFTC